MSRSGISLFAVKRAGLFAGLIAVIGLALASAPAWAAGGYVFEKAFGGPCTGAGGSCEPGQFSEPAQRLKEPSGVAVNEETGDVYVADKGNNRVEEFDPTGTTILREFDGAAAASGPLEKPEGIAVDNSGNPQDPSDHDVYVVDGAHQVIDKFSADGTYLGQFKLPKGPPGSQPPEVLKGVTVDRAGSVLVDQSNEEALVEVDRFSDALTNEFMSSSEAGCTGFFSAGLAVDSQDNLYVNCYFNFSGKPASPTVRKLTLAGQPLIEAVEQGPPRAVTVDAGDNVYVDNGGSISEFNEAPACTASAPCDESPAGSLIETFGEGHLTLSEGIAVNSATGFVYVADAATGTVAIFFAPPPLPLPIVQIKEATGLQSDGGATLNATVDPNGVPVTSCEFEYATDGEFSFTKTYNHSAPCSSPQTVSELDPLTGTGETAVSAQVTGPPLRAGDLLVDYRLKIGFAEVEGHTSEQSGATKFQTGPFPVPSVGGRPASAVSQSTATLNGTLQTGGAVVDYHFEYGTSTAYGSLAPIPDNYKQATTEAMPVSQPIGGLQAGVTYHYRLVASGPGGTEVKGPDQTFTTLPIPGPEASTGGASGVGVGSATISGAVDPRGWDTSYVFQYGTSSSYGANWPTVPIEMGALEGAQPVGVLIQNLLPGTTYHYRLVASNGGGTSYGPDMTFTTGEYPPSAVQEAPLLRTPAFAFPEETGSTATPTAKHTKKKRAKSKKPKRKIPKRGKRAKHAIKRHSVRNGS